MAKTKTREDWFLRGGERPMNDDHGDGDPGGDVPGNGLRPFRVTLAFGVDVMAEDEDDAAVRAQNLYGEENCMAMQVTPCGWDDTDGDDIDGDDEDEDC